MSVTRTFTVTVANPGAGNRYYIDGNLQETVNLIEGKTYRFDVSDSSVSGHPFKFSTTSNGTHNGGSEYTTGVTTSGTAGQTGAYVEIAVAASAPQLYYYCQYHSGMGGQANTVDSSVLRVLTVTVVSTGGGNKYFIDGVQQDTVVLAEGYTYRFDQSAGSNNNHPLRFSTTSNGTHSGGVEYTTGVTTNGVPGNPGAYTQIAVADSAPQLYYYCTNHSGMGGQADTESADNWGLLQWGQNSWGSQDGTTITLTGLSVTTSVGTVTAFNETGWGADTWGFEGWGGANTIIELPGLTATTALGTALDVIQQPGWGTLSWGQNSWGDVEGTEFTLNGLSLTTSVGVLAPEDVVGLTALPTLQTSVNAFATVSTDSTLTLTGLPLTITPGLLTTDDHSVGLPALTVLQTAVGSITPSDVMGLTGLTPLQTAFGEFAISSDPVTNVTGVSATTSLGTLTASPDSIQILSGQTGTTALGTVTTTQLSNVTDLPGLVATTGLNGDGLGFIYNRRLVPKTSGGYTRLVPKTSAGYTRKTP